MKILSPSECPHSVINSKVTASRVVDRERVRRRKCGLCGDAFSTREVSDFKAKLLMQAADKLGNQDRKRASGWTPEYEKTRPKRKRQRRKENQV